MCTDPTGGWWSRPSNWKMNTLLTGVVIGVMSVGIWRFSTEREVSSIWESQHTWQFILTPSVGAIITTRQANTITLCELKLTSYPGPPADLGVVVAKSQRFGDQGGMKRSTQHA